MDADADKVRRAVAPLAKRGLVTVDDARLVQLNGGGVLFSRRYLPVINPRNERALMARRHRWAWSPRFDRGDEIRRTGEIDRTVAKPPTHPQPVLFPQLEHV
jgi:hypothetical protein